MTTDLYIGILERHIVAMVPGPVDDLREMLLFVIIEQ